MQIATALVDLRGVEHFGEGVLHAEGEFVALYDALDLVSVTSAANRVLVDLLDQVDLFTLAGTGQSFLLDVRDGAPVPFCRPLLPPPIRVPWLIAGRKALP